MLTDVRAEKVLIVALGAYAASGITQRPVQISEEAVAEHKPKTVMKFEHFLKGSATLRKHTLTGFDVVGQGIEVGPVSPVARLPARPPAR